jgi:hypothetical protein
MPPHKYRSLVDPRGCSRIISIAEVDRRHAALVAPAKSGESRRPSAHCVRAKTMSEAAPRRPNRGSSGGRRKKGRVRSVPSGGSVDGRRFGLTTARRWRAARGWVLGSSVPGSLRWAVPGRDRERQRYVCSARGVPKKHARVGCAQNASQSSTQRRESKTQRSWCTRRPIAAPPGAGRAGNSIPASATKSPLSARVSARVLGRLAEAPIGIAQATSSGVGRSVGARGNQSAAEIAKGHLASPRRRLRANGS